MVSFKDLRQIINFYCLIELRVDDFIKRVDENVEKLFGEDFRSLEEGGYWKKFLIYE